MCVGVCLTRRGMVYFGASIHIFVTFILFIGSSVRAFHLTTYEKEDSRKEVLGGCIIAIYFFTLLMLGCLIFRATEQKNPKLLGWTGGIFITLETFAFIVNLMVLSPMGSLHDEYGFRNFGFSMNIVYIVISCIFLLCMMGYCATIIMYISKLKEDGDVSSGGGSGEDGEASSTSNQLSRTSSRTASTFFNRSQSHSQLDKDNKPGLGGAGLGGGGGGGFNLLEVVREAKRQKELKEQKELREKQKNASSSKNGKQQTANSKPKSHPSSSQQKPSSRPHTPQVIQPQPKLDIRHDKDGDKDESANKSASQYLQSVQTQAQGTQSDPIVSHSQQQIQYARHFLPNVQQRLIPPHDPQQIQPKPLMKSQEQETQTPPQVPYSPHPLPPPPNLLPPFNHTQSQTLPHRRTQLQQMHHQQPQPQPFDHNDHSRPYFLQEYSQRGILSAPSFNTASIVPHRFRNPSVGLRTTKSGTLLNRFDCITPPAPPPLGGRLQSLQRMTSSSCSSFDPLNPNFELDQWEQPRVQALKQTNYHYNALRRGTHRSDYGLGVEV